MTSNSQTAATVNAVGASWFEDLSSGFLDECLALGIGVAGCTANDTWDDTLETMENLQSVKRVIESHPNAFVVQSQADLAQQTAGTVGVLLGLQNPKPMSDSINFLEAFINTSSLVIDARREYFFKISRVVNPGMPRRPDCGGHADKEGDLRRRTGASP